MHPGAILLKAVKQFTKRGCPFGLSVKIGFRRRSQSGMGNA